jgi:hypothetical protein
MRSLFLWLWAFGDLQVLAGQNCASLGALECQKRHTCETNIMLRLSRAAKALCLVLAAGSASKAGRAQSPGWPGQAQAAEGSLLCVDGECGPLITEVKFQGRDAYKFSDGRTSAIIVPSLGRVMSYGLAGGPNLLFENPAAKIGAASDKKLPGWVNYGGDKTWPAPQDSWGLWQKSGGWPPPSQWDGAAHEAEVLTGGKLRTESPIHSGLGARVVRVYSMSEAGEFVIEQSIEKVSGGPLALSIWSVTQIAHPDAVYVRASSGHYEHGFHKIGGEDKYLRATALLTTATGGEMVRAEPSKEGTFKIGVDTTIVALASVKDGVAFVQKAARGEGKYPDGPTGVGFSIEIYNNAAPAYTELEMLSPLRNYAASKDGKSVGTRFTHTVRWSLHKLQDATDAAEIAALLDAK